VDTNKPENSTQNFIKIKIIQSIIIYLAEIQLFHMLNIAFSVCNVNFYHSIALECCISSITASLCQ